MSISLNDQHLVASDGAFRNKIRQSLATIVMDELSRDYVADGIGYEEATKRLTLSRRFSESPQDVAIRAAVLFATVTSTTDPDGVSDAAYVNFVGAHFSALAGYNPNTPPAPEESA